MPIYEYVCASCGKKTEVIQRMNAAPLKLCPHCGGVKLKKAFSAPAIQFKGSGFYITDYARGRDGGAKDPGKSERSEAGGKSEKAEGAAKSDKAEASGKSEASEKSEKAGKAEKAEKTEKTDKAEKKKEKKAAD